MDEQVWRNQWQGNIGALHRRVKEKNQLLINSNFRSRILSQFIDAVDLARVKKLAEENDHVFLITEQALDAPADNVTIVRVPCSFYGLYYSDSAEPDLQIQRDFNCFINRNDPIRQTWFYLFFDRNMLDHGFVSFNNSLRVGCKYPESVSTSEDYFDWIHENFLSSFDPIVEKIKQQVPYKNFVDTGDLSQIIMASKFSIILETYHDRPDCKVFSEKIFRALHLPRPWLLFAATGCVQRLRDFGFDVFDDYINHDYNLHDTAENVVATQESILEKAIELFDFVVTPSIEDDWQKKAAYNRGLLKDWNQRYSADFDAILYETFERAASV